MFFTVYNRTLYRLLSYYFRPLHPTNSGGRLHVIRNRNKKEQRKGTKRSEVSINRVVCPAGDIDLHIKKK